MAGPHLPARGVLRCSPGPPGGHHRRPRHTGTGCSWGRGARGRGRLRVAGKGAQQARRWGGATRRQRAFASAQRRQQGGRPLTDTLVRPRARLLQGGLLGDLAPRRLQLGLRERGRVGAKRDARHRRRAVGAAAAGAAAMPPRRGRLHLRQGCHTARWACLTVATPASRLATQKMSATRVCPMATVLVLSVLVVRAAAGNTPTHNQESANWVLEAPRNLCEKEFFSLKSRPSLGRLAAANHSRAQSSSDHAGICPYGACSGRPASSACAPSGGAGAHGADCCLLPGQRLQ